MPHSLPHLPAAGLSFTSTLLLANATTAAWLAVYHLLLEKPEQRVQQLWRHDSDAAASDVPSPVLAVERPERQQGGQRMATAEDRNEGAAEGGAASAGDEQQRLLLPPLAGSWPQGQQQKQQQQQFYEGGTSPKPSRAGRMGWRERLERTGAWHLPRQLGGGAEQCTCSALRSLHAAHVLPPMPGAAAMRRASHTAHFDICPRLQSPSGRTWCPCCLSTLPSMQCRAGPGRR